jgi:BlaI family transcriptional regulator, penicillinase repressor
MKNLTRAEEEVMQVMWELGPCTVADMRKLIAQKNQQTELPPHSTISTIVRILEEKGFVGHKAYGRTYEYIPLLSKEEYGKQSLQKLVKDYFGGSANRLVSALVQQQDLGLDELTRLLDELE